MKKNDIVKDMMDITVGTVIGGAAINVMDNANIPCGTFPGNTGNALKTGAQSLIGIGLVGYTSKKMKKYL